MRCGKGALGLGVIRLRPRSCAAWLLPLLALPVCALLTPPAAANAYPTPETADYVIGCMAANGESHEALLKCSCSIDYIAAHLPFSVYETAETALNMQAGGALGGRVGLFRDPPEIKDAIRQLRQAQAEADLHCSG